MNSILLVTIVLLISENILITHQFYTNCSLSDCYPDTGDLLIGRSKFLDATSTCGLNMPQRYCILGDTRDVKKCFVCDSTDVYNPTYNNNSHRIENIVGKNQHNRFLRWWQSENGVQNVTIQLNLEAEFTFTHIIMTFKTFRPAEMIIEKSSDFGRTWKVYGLFSHSCEESFPGVPTRPTNKLGTVYCESKYSGETPSTKGEIVFRILPPALTYSKDPYSNEIQDLLRITNLRINFTRLHTFGDNLLDTYRDEIKEKYYYALYEMIVRGSCLCYGHANKCIRVDDDMQYDTEEIDEHMMVHGKCECKHNTMGKNCEKCLPLYNDNKWQPARNGQMYECKKCECNGHAFSCHFDEKRLKETNGLSGGVCDNCQHNTTGANCELCKENFYRDPSLPISDEFTCKPCECSSGGSLKNGLCDPFSDERLNLIAGRCQCKENVDGDRCDRCKLGFYALSFDNPLGCTSCSCHLPGTIRDISCDQVTGSCECKSNVVGQKCDHCAPGYYGLSEHDPHGCKPCNCSLGGSIDFNCDEITGQCMCKPNMTGTRCDRPMDEYYCPSLTHLIYEAENALNEPNSLLRPFVSDYTKVYWTGNGLVRIHDQINLKFEIENIPYNGFYELAIRYQHSSELNTGVSIEISSDKNPSSFCQNYELQNSFLNLTSSNNYEQTNLSFCLEKHTKYVIKLEFEAYDKKHDGYLVVDSIILFPIIEKIRIFQKEYALLSDYEYYNCKNIQLQSDKNELNSICADITCDITVHTIGALYCDCDTIGSFNSSCSKIGGQCSCKRNVIGKKCDQCAPTTWGFDFNGCYPCNCDTSGAIDDFCNLHTGKCTCYENVVGEKCNMCKKGHYNFPYCYKCECNGLSDECDPVTGTCLGCTENTLGSHCEFCKDGYFGDPTKGISCQKCECPGGSSGNQFAKTCSLNTTTFTVNCNCEHGYRGEKCDDCAVNFFGNPKEPDGQCRPCECNDNIDTNEPYGCDPYNGKCLKCLYNTGGDSCERCAEGYYGDALKHDCKPCNCNEYGTDNNSIHNCDHLTGQCRCLPNVIGRNCDRCLDNHYGLSSGKGCFNCNCDIRGTVNETKNCNYETGQCECLSSRGGRTCSECRYGYWGDPTVKCHKCECLLDGSISLQCNKHNGACECKPGMTGYYCDKCNRGTYGEVPYCSLCGQCFDDWSETIFELREKFRELEDKASSLVIGSTGSLSDFSREYLTIESKLNDISRILIRGENDRRVKELNEMLIHLKRKLNSKKELIEEYYETKLWFIENPLKQLNNSRLEYELNKNLINDLNDKITNLNENTYYGAMKSINKSYKIFNKASNELSEAINLSDNKLKPTVDALNAKLQKSTKFISNSFLKTKKYLESINKNITKAFELISELNKTTCITGDNICDSNLINEYLLAIERYINLYNQHEKNFKAIILKWKNAYNDFFYSNKELVNMQNSIENLFNSINGKRKEILSLTQNITKFIKENEDLPLSIENTCKQLLDKEISIDNNEFYELIQNIKLVSLNLNGEEILQDAKDKENIYINDIISKIKILNEQMDLIRMDLLKANKSLLVKSHEINEAERKLEEIKNKNKEIIDNNIQSKVKLNDIKSIMNSLDETLDEFKQGNYLESNSIDKNKQEFLESKSKETSVMLDRTKNSLNKLEDKLNKFLDNLNETSNDKNLNTIKIIINLKTEISLKKEFIEKKRIILSNMEKEYGKNKNKLTNLSKVLNSLKEHTIKIQKEIINKERYFSTCT